MPFTKEDLKKGLEQHFGVSTQQIHYTYAPGRCEVIGNHTDYNQGTVMGASLDRGVYVAVRENSGDTWNFYSDFGGEIVKVPISNTPTPLKDRQSWVNYPLGCLASFPHFKLQLPKGFDYICMSDLPTGAGLSSSAAMENASALAFLQLTKQQLDKTQLVLLSKRAENEFVGVPCGVLDQGVSGFGKPNSLVYIDCQGTPTFDTVEMEHGGVNLWIFNTHTKHALVDGMYSKRHEECMTAAKILGVDSLRKASPEMVEQKKSEMPENVYKRAKHVVEEIARVATAQNAMKKGDLKALGKDLFASHRSSQKLFENSTPELDFLVDTLERMQNRGVYGARLTGGGFGGAVMAFCSDDFGEKDAGEVKKAYEATFGGETIDVLPLHIGRGALVL